MDKAKILLVDDTPTNLEILSEILSPEYHISAAINGMEALDLAMDTPPPDIILLDIMMPGLDGYQVCEALKANSQTRPIPVLFVTSIDEMESEEKGFALGAVDYIIKPIKPSIVLARVKTHLSLYNKARLLESLVEERTTELEKARDEAEAANKAKSGFLSNISHELRTPLNGIMGMTQLLLQTNPSDEQSDFLEDAQLSSSRLLNMVNDLLALSEVEAGYVKLRFEKCNLRETLEHINYHYGSQAHAKGLDFSLAIDDSVPQTVITDASRIRQVLINMLNNAFRFTGKGSINLTLDTREAVNRTGSTDDVILIFTIADTGVGIPPERQETIFEAFSIGEDFMTKEHCGAGLGLTTSKRLVNLMGGHIWLEHSQEGNTVFGFTIPCEAPQQS